MYRIFGLDIRTVREGVRENYPSYKTAEHKAIKSGIYGYLAQLPDGKYIAHDWAIAGRRTAKLVLMRINPRPIPASLVTSLDIVETTPTGVIVKTHDRGEVEVVLYADKRFNSAVMHTEASLFHGKLLKELTAKGLY